MIDLLIVPVLRFTDARTTDPVPSQRRTTVPSRRLAAGSPYDVCDVEF